MSYVSQWAVGLSIGAVGAIAVALVAAKLRSDLSDLRQAMRPLRSSSASPRQSPTLVDPPQSALR